MGDVLAVIKNKQTNKLDEGALEKTEIIFGLCSTMLEYIMVGVSQQEDIMVGAKFESPHI